MAESVLVNRKKFISSLDNKLVEPLNALSKKTRVPKSRLLDRGRRPGAASLAPIGLCIRGSVGAAFMAARPAP